MNEEIHMGWKLVSGVRQDTISLFKMFANTNSIRFEDFCRVWKEVKFSHLYKNRITVIEILEFTEEIFQIIKEYVSSVYEFHTRVSALYTLYGLYFKQPIRGAAKIRFTKTEWQDLMNLIETSKSAKHYDVVFIFTKLYLSGAYTFAATKRPEGLERGYRKYSEKRNRLVSKSYDTELMYRPLVSEQLVNTLVKLESLYCRKKSELLGKKNLVFIDGKFAESLQEELKSYSSALEVKPSARNKSLLNTKASIVSDTQPESSQIGVSQTKRGKVSKTAEVSSDSRPDQNSDEEVSCKKKKFGKKYSALLAKKKAECFIRKIQSNQGPAEKKVGPWQLFEGNISESEESTEMNTVCNSMIQY